MAKQLKKLGRRGKIKAILIASAIMFPSLNFLSFKDRSKDLVNSDDGLAIFNLSSFAYGRGGGSGSGSCGSSTVPTPPDTGDCIGSEPANIGTLQSVKLSGSAKKRVKPVGVSGRKCYEVSKANAAGYDLFLPLKTSTEFKSFDQSGSGVNVKDITRK